MTKARSVQERAFILSDKHLPLPLGEVAERSEVGEGLPIFIENREALSVTLTRASSPKGRAKALCAF